MSFEVAQRPMYVYVECRAAYVSYPNVSNRTEMVTMDLKQLPIHRRSQHIPGKTMIIMLTIPIPTRTDSPFQSITVPALGMLEYIYAPQANAFQIQSQNHEVCTHNGAAHFFVTHTHQHIDIECGAWRK